MDDYIQKEIMLGIYAPEKITLSTFPDALNKIFYSYPDISSMLLQKVVFDTQKESDVQAFVDNINSLN